MPEILKSTEITKWQNVQMYNGVQWVPARMEARNCILPWYQRYVAAWKVLIGEYDAFRWVGNNE